MSLLEVRNVKKVYTTRFGGNQVEALRNVNFSVEPGEYVAVMGESGSGKSTLLNILAALDRPTKGKVYLKGRDLSGIKEKEMAAFRRQNLGFVFQDFHLLDTFSLRDNIFLPLVLSGMKYGKMEERLQPVAKQLEITQLLDKYPYEVSGGQKQRLSIARAIAKHPDVYIFDDSFSALDYKTDAVLRKELKAKTKDSTVIIVAQRISTILHAEQIIVLDDGQIVGKGTHKELLKSCEAYYQIASSQLSEKELEADMKEVD